ncbi:ATP-binding cassette domain-containing protein [Rhizobium sp. NRK18]|uniref:ABC transporter ATP-binding protein n=1 Tax=Rhizobium sp. NRK18 TaxID=2964667 RepID=UPI0021C3B124|nr:ATP-binding cassette domain-containing protein [Rhizobium sp. NRK18]MCQ2002962.1 ATP-binding cassette domain-containing protein [Rhizobium sp. NRK18]
MSPIIRADRAAKIFRQRIRQPGLAGSLRYYLAPETKEVRAVEDISFEIGMGEAVGYLGPNGAGKSTMIKMLTGILVPTAGEVQVLGRTPHEERIANAREIGVVFGQRSQLWWDLPLADSFDLHRRIYRVEKTDYEQTRDELVAMLQITPYIDRPVRQLSLGQRMRAEIAMALMHSPKILFLDEPTIGLDVVAKDVVRKFLAEINRERGTTIILTTHDLKDIEEICPRLIMVDEGKLLFDGPLARLNETFGARRRLTLEFADDPGPVTVPGAELIEGEGIRRVFTLDHDRRSLVEIIASLGDGRALVDVRLEEPDIEDVIRTYYQSRMAG